MKYKKIAAVPAIFLWSSLAFAIEQSHTEEIAKTKAKILEQEAVADVEDASSSAPRTITKTEARVVDADEKKPLNDPLTCLSRTLYREARGQSVSGIEAIANVVMNRLVHADFPNTICDVVTQGSEQGSCQFSWWCDGHSDKASEESYITSKEIARKALNQQLSDHTNGAIYFHHREIEPDWSLKFIKTFETEEHVFYKPKTTE